MLTHVVLLQPKPETTKEQITTALDHVKALQPAISGILDIQAGRNMSSSYQGYTYGFVIRFVDSLAAGCRPHWMKAYTYGFVIRFVDSGHLKAYAPHPAHQPV